MSCTRSMRSTYLFCAHEAITLLTCPQTDRLFEIFMPSILIVVTRLTLGSGVGIWIQRLCLLFVNTISSDLVWLSFRLLVCDKQKMFSAVRKTVCSQIVRERVPDRRPTATENAEHAAALVADSDFRNGCVDDWQPQTLACQTLILVNQALRSPRDGHKPVNR